MREAIVAKDLVLADGLSVENLKVRKEIEESILQYAKNNNLFPPSVKAIRDCMFFFFSFILLTFI